MEHKIVSCIPTQSTDTEEKFQWLSRVQKKYQPHIIVTPQEYFGGAVMMYNRRDFAFDELFPRLSDFCKDTGTALVVGVQQRDPDGSNKTVIWFINEKGQYMGRLVKFALPGYDHIKTNGFGGVTPEDSFENRFKTFKLHNLVTTGMFCWEVYSDVMWTGLGILKPDVVFSPIKFGVNAWPKLKKKNGLNTVVGFGYGKWGLEDEGGWIRRLKAASEWQVKCPIICSTNSWNINPRALPMCGTISQIPGQAEEDYWIPKKEDGFKTIPEKVVVSTIDENRVRGVLKNKFAYVQAVGEFPPFSIGKYTMHLKINRIEDRLIRTMQKVQPHQKKKNNKALL